MNTQFASLPADSTLVLNDTLLSGDIADRVCAVANVTADCLSPDLTCTCCSVCCDRETSHCETQ